MEYISLAMTRESLEGVPRFELPAPFALRWYQPGDEAHWLRINAAADTYSAFPPETFEEQFGSDARELARRQCYLCDGDGLPVGTTTAWFLDDYKGRPYGRVHWVAIVPELQGGGLAKPLLAAVLHRLRDLGHPRAYLSTATVRLAALNLYLRFGFLPDLRGDEDLRGWRLVAPHLKPQYWRRAAALVPELA